MGHAELRLPFSGALCRRPQEDAVGSEPRVVSRWEKLIFYGARMTRTMTRFAQRQSTASKEMQLLFPSTLTADFQILDSLNKFQLFTSSIYRKNEN